MENYNSVESRAKDSEKIFRNRRDIYTKGE